jgi:hypothetical protein
MFTTELMANANVIHVSDLLDVDIDSCLLLANFFSHPRYAMQIQNKPHSTLHLNICIYCLNSHNQGNKRNKRILIYKNIFGASKL